MENSTQKLKEAYTEKRSKQNEKELKFKAAIKLMSHSIQGQNLITENDACKSIDQIYNYYYKGKNDD